MIKPDSVFDVITPDQVAETWDGIYGSGNLYEKLWECVKYYDNSYRENIEDIGPNDVIGINCLSEFWDRFSQEHQLKLNELAKEMEKSYAS